MVPLKKKKKDEQTSPEEISAMVTPTTFCVREVIEHLSTTQA